MHKLLIRLLIFFIVFSFSRGSFAKKEDPPFIQGPVLPTKSIVAESTVPKKTIEELDLPYKPPDVEADGTLILPDEAGTPESDDPSGPKKRRIVWENIPYIPPRGPDLSPAPDPVVEY